ncbi:MAG: SDR family NAD(P)-dependent oxidoreductase [Gammaproteobacteria bacterium]|nr:SDR family NAD(P)-dependent oxidoreductase [Gammaproteobacteria bacterium]
MSDQRADLRSGPLCLIIGIGPGNGEALARRFSAAGYRLGLLSRSTEQSQALAAELGRATAYACDVSEPGAIEQTLAQVRAELGPVESLIYNPAIAVWKSIEEATPDEYEACWRVNALGLAVAAKAVIPEMKKAGRGNIAITGATASKRGGAESAPFAAAKAAQYSLAQSMARQLGPAGIHVSYVVIDGIIDLPRTREMFPERADETFMRPAEIAETIFQICQQPRSAWTFELDLRPYGESW